jgi:cell division protein FtsI (penicillin-binding protein 3)
VRFWLICIFFFAWACAIGGRLAWLQLLHHSYYADQAQQRQQRTTEVAPRRGVLYDRNLHELAMTVQVDSIFAVPSEIDDKPAAARALSALVHTDPDDDATTEQQIAARMAKSNNFIWVARRVSADVSTRVHDLNMKGVYFRKEFKRFYPDNEIAAQMLGYVGIDDNGLGGIEKQFDSDLHGAPGLINTNYDARHKPLGSTEKEPNPGRNLVLTIDESIQFMAEKALDHAMQRTQAASGTVIIQDVHTGQILALAVRPAFNPNGLRHASPEMLRDHAVSDVYEPGSTFKLVTYSAALDQHAASPDDNIDCQGGQITLAGRVIHDNQGEHYGVVPVHKALEVSSDVAAVKLALKVGPDRFYDYVRAFGFGARSNVELPGETRGLLRPPAKWSGSSIGSIAIGQEIAVTPVQLVTMVSTIANGGVYLPPHVLMPQPPADSDKKLAPPQVAQPFKPGGDLPNPLPDGSHRVVSGLTAAQMRKMMEGVVLFGTGKSAQLNGYSSGGKTGTAQKIDPATHTYSKTMHVASFAGFAPVNNPVIAVAVVIDNPKGAYYGADVSAPVFSEVAQQVLEYLSVPHDIDIHATRNSSVNNAPLKEDDDERRSENIDALYAAANDLPSDDPLSTSAAAATATPTPTPTTHQQATPNQAAQTPAQASQKSIAPQVPAAQQQPSTQQVAQTGGMLTVPNLIGLPTRKIIEQAAAAGLEVEITGTGTAREQAPAAGVKVPPGTHIAVRASR